MTKLNETPDPKLADAMRTSVRSMIRELDRALSAEEPRFTHEEDGLRSALAITWGALYGVGAVSFETFNAGGDWLEAIRVFAA